MSKLTILLIFITTPLFLFSQDTVKVDDRVQPYLNEFFKYCKKYDIDYNEKFTQLESISVVDSLPLSKYNTVLGKVLRDEHNAINKIVFNWVTLFDKEILKVVAFHEFAHHFLDYRHTCRNCNEIMAEVNISYFDIVRDWDNQVEQLFVTSPAYLKLKSDTSMASN